MIKALDVFKAFEPYRGKSVVIASGTAGGHWHDVTTNKMRDVSLGGAMGQTTSAAFGLALGLPNEKIVLFSTFRETLNYLAERLNADGISGSDAAQPRFLLHRRTEVRDDLGDQGVVDGSDDGDRRARTRDGLDGEDVTHVIEAEASPLTRDRDAEQSPAGGVGNEIPWKPAGGVDFSGERRDPLPREGVHLVPEPFLIGCELEMHATPAPIT